MDEKRVQVVWTNHLTGRTRLFGEPIESRAYLNLDKAYGYVLRMFGPEDAATVRIVDEPAKLRGKKRGKG